MFVRDFFSGLLNHDEQADILGLRIIENIGPLVVLESFLAIGVKLFQVTDAKQLPAIKKDIDDLLQQVIMMSSSVGQTNILSDDSLNELLHHTALFLYYRTCLEFKVKLSLAELTECANVKKTVFMSVPTPHHSFTDITNLIFSIVLVTKEIIELPQSLDNVEPQNIQEYLMAAQVILLMAANTAKRALQKNRLDDTIKRGLTCMLSGHESSGTSMDEFAKALAKQAYKKIAAWCHSISKRREGLNHAFLDSLFHYETTLVTLCGFYNYQEDTPFQQQIAEQREQFLPFAHQVPGVCDAFYFNLLGKSAARCEKIERIMHAIISNRALDGDGAMTWQRIATNALNIFATEILLARIQLKSGVVKFSHPDIALQVERGLDALALIYATTNIDALPRRSVAPQSFNKLWLVTEIGQEISEADFANVIHCASVSDVMTSLVSAWLVTKVTIHCSGNRADNQGNRNLLFSSLVDKLNSILKLAEASTDIKKKKNIHHIAIDLYYYLLKFSAYANENTAVMTGELPQKMAALVKQSVHAKRYQFLYAVLHALKAENKNASDLTSEFVAYLEKKNHKQYTALFKLAKDSFRNLDFYDKNRMNYHVHIDFVMFGTIFFAKSPKGNCVNGVKLAFYRNDMSECSFKFIREMGIEAGEFCGVKYEIIDARNAPEAPVKPRQPLAVATVKNDGRGFLPPELPRKLAAVKSKRKKKQLEREEVVHDTTPKRIPPNINAGFPILETFFESDYASIAAYVRSKMFLPKVTPVDRYYALVALALCLEKLRESDVATFIKQNADTIFSEARCFFPERTEFNEDRAFVYDVLSRVDQDERSEKSDTTDSSAMTDSASEDFEELESETQPIVVSHVPATVFNKSAVVKRTHHRKFNLQQVLAENKPAEQREPLVFPFTKGQWVIMRMLETCGHETFVHGSSVISAAKNKPVTDIDLLCYVDSLQLQQYLHEHQEALGISWSSLDINHPERLFIFLKETKPNGDPVKMELVCHGKLIGPAMIADMKKMQRSYWFSSLLANPYHGNIIDFYHQYEWLIKRSKITSVVREPRPVVKFEDSPMSMIKLIIRLAYFRKVGAPFTTTYALRTGMIVNSDRLSKQVADIDSTINTIDWEKLFLRGHAKESFDELMFFDFFRVIFPAFDKMTTEQMQKVSDVFSSFDAYLQKKYQHELTEQQYAKERIELLKRLVICYLDVSKLKTKLSKNIDALKETIRSFLSGINLMQIDKLVQTIEHRVIKQLYHLDKPPKRKTVSALFVPAPESQQNPSVMRKLEKK